MMSSFKIKEICFSTGGKSVLNNYSDSIQTNTGIIQMLFLWARKPKSSEGLSVVQVFCTGAEEKTRLLSPARGKSWFKEGQIYFCPWIFFNTCRFSLWSARVFEYLLLVHTAQSAGKGRKSRLPGKTGQSEAFGWNMVFPSSIQVHVGANLLQQLTPSLDLVTGGSSHQRAHDEKRQHDGRIPTFRKQSQLFPHGCPVSTGFPERHGFLSGWNWKAW